jgi:Xaa-Pro aminopeptidase
VNTSSKGPDSGRQRVNQIADLLTVEGIDALLCATPSNVLLVSGYWPVVGTSMAIATRSGAVVVIAPQDEEDLARAGWADHVRLYSPGSVKRITGPVETIGEPLSAALQYLGLESGRVAIDDGPLFEESTYSAAFHWRASLRDIAVQAVPQVEL